MDKIIERLLDGQFEYDRGTLEFSESRLELTLFPGKEAEGAFVVFGPKEKPIEGYCLSSELRMKVLTPFFSGDKDTISYRFHARGLTGGDVLKGNFRIISNCGEYLIPFVVNVETAHVNSDLGEIRNLYHFANLAKTDWDEALRLFYSDEFEKILTGHEAHFVSVYRGLSVNRGDPLALEEFLLSANKKQPVDYIPDKPDIKLQELMEPTRETIVLSRNGWGYTSLNVQVDGDFIIPDKDILGEEDFISNTCRFEFLIDPAKLHGGINYGAITFSNAYVSRRVRVTVRAAGATRLPMHYLDKKAMNIELVRLYESFRGKKLSAAGWLTEAGDLVNRMMAMDGSDLTFQLYHTHYLITASRADEGAYQLEQMEARITANRDQDDTLRCYYLYLKSLVTTEEEELNAISDEIERIFHAHPDSWRIAWLLQFVSEEFSLSPSRKWDLFRDQFARGCKSPVLYIEALDVISLHPTMLMRLDSFTVALLTFATKRGYLTDALIDQCVYLISRTKGYDAKLLNILRVCYENKKTDDTLEVICGMLIKGNRTDEEAFPWYALGIEKNIRLTRLYEYYMMSLHTDDRGEITVEIPRSVLMYFSYQSDLDYKRNAMLFRYVTERREQFPDLYEVYAVRIRPFLYEQIDRMRINPDLGYLYRKHLDDELVTATNAANVLTLIYTAAVRVSSPLIREVIVVYDKLRDEMRYPLSSGEAYVPLFGSDYAIVLADENGNRYAGGVSYEIIKLMIPGRLSAIAVPYIVGGDENHNLFLCGQTGGAASVNMENVGRFRELEKSPRLREESRLEIRDQLIRFYYDNDFQRQLTELLSEEDPGKLTAAKRSSLLEMLVLTGECGQAYAWLKEYGTYGVDPRIIVRLTSRYFDKETMADELEATEIVADAFRKGKYDNKVLEFLVARYEGTVREMRDIWKAAASFGVDTYALSERMIRQMLYTDAYIGDRTDVYRDYVQQGGGSELEAAFLSAASYDHLVKEKITTEYYYQRIARLTDSGVRLPDVCRMDYLRFYAENNREEMDTELASRFLNSLLTKDICFPFFMEYQDTLKEVRRFSDRVFLQYRSAPGRRVVVHYLMSGEDEEQGYTAMEMREMYDSIYVASFILFFGEEVQYYITEEEKTPEDITTDRMEQLTESGTLSRSDIRQGTHTGRFSMINDMMIAVTLQDYETFDRLIQDYYRTRFTVDRLFQVKGGSDAV